MRYERCVLSEASDGQWTTVFGQQSHQLGDWSQSHEVNKEAEVVQEILAQDGLVDVNNDKNQFRMHEHTIKSQFTMGETVKL